MNLYNETGTIGIIIDASVQNVTGSLFISLLLLTIIIMAFFMLFRLPIEATAILILPMLLIFMAFENGFLAAGGVIIIYLAVLFAKNFIIQA